MGLLIILPFLISGYIVFIRHPFYYLRLHRFQGQLLYLQVARMGMTCLIVATLLSAVFLVLSKQKVSVAGYEVATDYSSYLGALLIQLDVANKKNCALWVFLLQVGSPPCLSHYSGRAYTCTPGRRNCNWKQTRSSTTCFHRVFLKARHSESC